MMGRKIKPLGLRRKAISISLPLDIINWLDKLVLSSDHALSRSKITENSLRTSMNKGQTTLGIENKDEVRYVWSCPRCERRFHVNRLTETFLCRCGFWLDAKEHYEGIWNGEEE